MKTLTIVLLLFINDDVGRIASQIDSTVGVAALNIDTGRRISIRGSERFPMGSVYKFPIAIEFLRQVDGGKFRLKDEVTIQPSDFSLGYSPIRDKAKGKPVKSSLGALLQAMLGESDNTASDALLRMVTPAAVTRRMKDLRTVGIRIDRTEKQIAEDIKARGEAAYAADVRDTASPDAMVELLTRVVRRQDGLTAASRNLMLKIMTEGPRNRIKASLPPKVVVAHKSGQMPGTRNDVGIVTAPDGTLILIAVFTKAGVRSTDDKRGEVISQIARRVYDHFTGAAGSTTRQP
jgi:beta-lactamase class A